MKERQCFGFVGKQGNSWREFFEQLKRVEIPPDFLDERGDTVAQERSG